VTTADDKCNSCAANYYFITDALNTPKKCFGSADQPTGKYLNKVSKFWEACNAECATCNMFFKEKCLTCTNLYNFKEGYDSVNGDTCYDSNGPTDFKYFKDGTLWKKCAYNCLTCNGKLITNCLTCATDYFFIENYNTSGDICLNNKPANNYYKNNNLWKKCNVACDSCNGSDENSCLTCSSKYYFKDNAPAGGSAAKCWNTKPSTNYYLDTTNSSSVLWKTCTSPCATCSASGAKCLTCIDTYYFTQGYDVTGAPCTNNPPTVSYYLDVVYKPCSANCLTCTSGTDDKCTSCVTDYFKKTDASFTSPGTKCFSKDTSPAGYYWAVGLTNHNACGGTCATCLGAADACLTCNTASNFYFRFKDSGATKICYATPLSDFTLVTKNAVLAWDECDISCNQCTGSAINCNACKNTYFPKEILPWSKPCYNSSPTGFWFDSTASLYKACEVKCATCQNSAGYCLTCNNASNYYYTEDERNNCYNEAPNGYILDDSTTPKIYVKRNILKLNQLEDLTFEEVEPSFSGRYTMEFWMMSSANTLQSGIHFIWRNHVSTTILQNPTTSTSLNVYCWPRDYLTFNLPNTFGTTIPTYQTTFSNNSAAYTLTSYAGTWIFVRCAVNFNDRNFYLNVSDNIVSKNFLNENISQNNPNDAPLRYFHQPGEKSQFRIIGGSKNSGTNIYIRTLALFNEFIPNMMRGFRN